MGSRAMSTVLERIPFFKPNLPCRSKLERELVDSIYSHPLNEGDLVYEFEARVADFLGVADAVAVSSGTAALHLALVMAGVKDGDYVISTSLTAEPTNTVIRSVGAHIIYCDLDANTGLLDLNSLKASDLKKSKAFIVVHYGGYVQNIEDTVNLCSTYSIKVLEDCAHALGSEYNDQMVGTFGDYGCFSFQAIKQITTIEGGAIITKHSTKLPLLRQSRWFGLQKLQSRQMTNITFQGFKYNFNNVHAKIGLLQFSEYGAQLKKVRSIATAYKTEISQSFSIFNVADISNSINSNWLFLTKVQNMEHATTFFDRQEITTGRVHKLNHRHEYLKADRDLIGAETFENNLFHLPIGAWMTDGEIERVLNGIRAYRGIIND